MEMRRGGQTLCSGGKCSERPVLYCDLWRRWPSGAGHLAAVDLSSEASGCLPGGTWGAEAAYREALRNDSGAIVSLVVTRNAGLLDHALSEAGCS